MIRREITSLAGRTVIIERKIALARKKTKPSTPDQIAARKTARQAEQLRRLGAEAEARHDPGLWGPNEAALRLEANGAVRQEAETRIRVRRIVRQSVFDLMVARCQDAGRKGELGRCLPAIDWLQERLAVLHRTVGQSGEGGMPRAPSPGTGFDLSARRLRAGEEIDAVLARTGALSARILLALCNDAAVSPSGQPWRMLVAAAAQERTPAAQDALVRSAMLNLGAAYAHWTHGGRGARAA